MEEDKKKKKNTKERLGRILPKILSGKVYISAGREFWKK